MFARLLLAFTVIPLIELALLFQLSQVMGWGSTICLVLLTGLVGAALARQQGNSAWRQVSRQLAAGQMPSTEIMDGLLILFAGAFLITPGLLTDLTGFALLIPAVRRRVRSRLGNWFSGRVTRMRATGQASGFQFQSFMYSTDSVPPSADKDVQTPQVRVVDPSTGRIEDTDIE